MQQEYNVHPRTLVAFWKWERSNAKLRWKTLPPHPSNDDTAPNVRLVIMGYKPLTRMEYSSSGEEIVPVGFHS